MCFSDQKHHTQKALFLLVLLKVFASQHTGSGLLLDFSTIAWFFHFDFSDTLLAEADSSK